MPRDLSQLDTTVQIVTPENIAFDYRVAGPFRRWPAFLLDLGIRFGLYFAIVTASLFIGSWGGGGLGPILMTILITWFVLEWFYGGLFETFWNGQTPGKWVMGIRVLSVNGEPINGMQAVMRNVLRMVDMAPFLSVEMFGAPAPMYSIPTFLVGLIAMALNRRFQRVGDLVCGTVVVIEDRHWLTGVVKLEDPRAARLAELLPADFVVGQSLSQALSSYVERRRYFTPQRRSEVARHVAGPLLAEFGFPPDTSHDLLLCALYYRTFIADHTGQGESGESPFGALQRKPPSNAAMSAPQPPFEQSPGLPTHAAGSEVQT